MSKVIIGRCSSYNEFEVEKALRQALEKLGGIETFVKPGQKVLLKPNLLQVAEPHQAATTHPAVVKAMARMVKEAGAQALIGDSPGFALAKLKQIWQVTGMQKAAAESGAELIEFQRENIQSVKSPSQSKRLPQLLLSKAVLNADAVINLPKLKTHGFTLFSGAIKNLYGVIPGFHKSHYHFQAPQLDQFCEMLADLYQIVRPRLTIMDAIWAMEGDGPSAGNPKSLGFLLVSSDGVAVDAVSSAMVGFAPEEIWTTQIAAKRGLGEGNLSKIEIEGLKLETIKCKDFKKPRKNLFYLLHRLPPWLRRLVLPLAEKLLWVKPQTISDKCTGCLICVKACPAQTIKQRGKRVWIDPAKCIMCFCCQELCEHKAIKLQASWLMRLRRLA